MLWQWENPEISKRRNAQKRPTVSFLFALSVFNSFCRKCLRCCFWLAEIHYVSCMSRLYIASIYPQYAEQLFCEASNRLALLKAGRWLQKKMFVHQMFATHEFGFYFWQGYT